MKKFWCRLFGHAKRNQYLRQHTDRVVAEFLYCGRCGDQLDWNIVPLRWV